MAKYMINWQNFGCGPLQTFKSNLILYASANYGRFFTCALNLHSFFALSTCIASLCTVLFIPSYFHLTMDPPIYFTFFIEHCTGPHKLAAVIRAWHQQFCTSVSGWRLAGRLSSCPPLLWKLQSFPSRAGISIWCSGLKLPQGGRYEAKFVGSPVQFGAVITIRNGLLLILLLHFTD